MPRESSMRWSERQVAMLREMGIRVWSREAPDAHAGPESGADVLVAEEPWPRAVAAAERVAETAPAPAPAAPLAGPASAPALASAEWLVVGEPFDAIGGAGDLTAADQERLLDNMLRAIGVSRAAPAREARACHLAVVEGGAVDIDATLAAVAPRCILALGRTAAIALLGLDEPLGRLRERVHERSGVPVVVSFALPYLLRHPSDKAKAWADLCRAVAALG
jgi:uracil-DNA glycosylase family 4